MTLIEELPHHRGADLSRRELLIGGLMSVLPVAAEPTPARAAFATRALPARMLPVPDTVSPQLQAFIAAAYPEGWNVVPRNAAAWKELARQSSAAVASDISAIRERFKIDVQPSEIAGVQVFIVTPADLPQANRERLLLHVHGGGYVLYPGEAGAGEAMLMAGFGKFKVVSVDYRMAPEFPFPAALDDAMAVWRHLVSHTDPRKMGIFGTSAGGGLTLAMVLQAKALRLPLPAAIAPGSPWVDLTGDGDSLKANEFVDNVLVSMSGWAGAAARLYAAGHDLSDPLLSPIYGDFRGLPPAILTSGTRDLFLSDTVRAHRKLRAADVKAVLQVFEGQSHAQFLLPFLPETEDAFAELARFFQSHLAA
jgi:epsilon-lactone hydrolase